MHLNYQIGPLRRKDVARAYVLMQAGFPGLTLETWKAETAGEIARGRFTVATDGSGCLRAISLAQIITHPIAGRVLDVPVFIVASPLEEDEIGRQLFQIERERAANSDCSHLRVWSLEPSWEHISDPAIRDRWDHGLIYELEGL